MWGLQESQQGLKLARHWDLIKTQSRSLPEPTRAPTPFPVPPHFFLFYTNTFRQMHILSHTQGEKNINLKSHMDKHILSHAIRLWPISNHPQLRGRKTMYKSQCNMLSYLWLWPMTWVYLHYTVAHSKSFTSVGDYWHGRRKRQQPRCCIHGSLQTVLRITLAFLPNAPNHWTGVSGSMAESTHLGVTSSDLTSSQVGTLCFNPYTDHMPSWPPAAEKDFLLWFHL